MTFLVACPFVHAPSFEIMWGQLHPELRERAIPIDNTELNLGAAGSRNLAQRVAAERGVDWVVEVSPVVRFGPPGGLDFVRALEDHADAWVVQSWAPLNWHLIAWSTGLPKRVGLWDENFWPVYGEDGDMSRRIHLAAAEDGHAAAWACVPVDAWITMHGHSVRLANVQVDYPTIWSYYEAKWGGRSGEERFTRPFDAPDIPLSWWPSSPDPRAIERPRPRRRS